MPSANVPRTSTLAAAVRVWPGAAKPEHTLDLMVKQVMESFRQPAVVERAGRIAMTVQEKDPAAIAAAIARWLRARIRFVPDPVNEQLLKTPAYLLEAIDRDGRVAADCVDVAMLAAALLMAVGIQAEFFAEAYDEIPDRMHADLVHVYAVAQTGNGPTGWVWLDTQRGADAQQVEPVRRVRMTIP